MHNLTPAKQRCLCREYLYKHFTAEGSTIYEFKKNTFKDYNENILEKRRQSAKEATYCTVLYVRPVAEWVLQQKSATYNSVTTPTTAIKSIPWPFSNSPTGLVRGTRTWPGKRDITCRRWRMWAGVLHHDLTQQQSRVVNTEDFPPDVRWSHLDERQNVFRSTNAFNCFDCFDMLPPRWVRWLYASLKDYKPVLQWRMTGCLTD